MYDLLQVMQQDGYLSSGELIALRKTCKELGENPVRILRSLNIASPEQIQEYLQRYFRVNALGDQAIALLDEGYQTYIPIDLAIHYSCFGLGEENSVLYVAMEDPSDRGAIRQLRFFLNKRIIAIAATVFQLAEGLSKIYRVSIPNLRLTTVIERSRGVVGGLRYEAPYEAQAHTIGDDFAGANLSDENSEDVNSFVTTIPENSLGAKGSKNGKAEAGALEPSAEISAPEIAAAGALESPSVGFIDGSSGEVGAGMLEADSLPVENPIQEAAQAPAQTGNEESLLSAEDDAGEQQASAAAPAEAQINSEDGLLSEDSGAEASAAAPAEAQINSEDGLLSEDSGAEASAAAPAEAQINSEDGLLSEDSGADGSTESLEVSDDLKSDENSVGQEISENEIAHLSALASSALVKVSMMQEKSQAIELVNTLLDPFKFSVTLEGNDSYQVSGEGFSATGDLNSQIKKNDNPVFCAIDPILKRILKMKNSA